MKAMNLIFLFLALVLAGCADPRGCTDEEIDVPNADLRNCYLVNRDLSGRDLSGADLRGADLSMANLQGADLAEAKLSGKWAKAADLLTSGEGAEQDFSGWDLSHMYLVDADLRGANLTECNLDQSNLTGADLSGADLSRANVDATLDEADLSGAILHEADMSVSSLKEAKLIDADLRRVDLRYANLRGADLTDADLRGANLDHANLTYATVNREQLYMALTWQDAILPWDVDLTSESSTWRAVIAFTDSETRTLDWESNWLKLSYACQYTYITTVYFDASQAESDQVIIGPKEAPLAILDMAPYVEQYHRGYLFVQEGHPPHYQAYTSSDVLINNASQYFGIPLTNP